MYNVHQGLFGVMIIRVGGCNNLLYSLTTAASVLAIQHTWHVMADTVLFCLPPTIINIVISVIKPLRKPPQAFPAAVYCN